MGNDQDRDLLRTCGVSVIYMLNGGFNHRVEVLGGELLSVTMRMMPGDCLLVIRAEFPGGRRVAFVGSSNAAYAVKKAEKELRENTLRWRQDKYAK